MSIYSAQYAPHHISDHTDFKVYPEDASLPYNAKQNLSCAYNEKQELHLVQRPMPQALQSGQVVVHIRATFVHRIRVRSGLNAG